MPRNILLLSIHPEFAHKIFCGTKTAELRRVRPRVARNDIILIYVTSPISALSGAVKVQEVITASPNILWGKIRYNAGVSWNKFNEYYEGSNKAFAILFENAFPFSNVIKLCKLRKIIPNFHPPQSYLYLRKEKKFLNLFKKLDFNSQFIQS